MNTDIRIAVSFRGHRKRKRLRALLGPGSTDYLLDLWISTAQNHPSGTLSGMDELDIALEAGWEGDAGQFVGALMECGFLEKDAAGIFSLHDWEDHQGYVVHAEKRKEIAKKAAAKRWENRTHASSMPQACSEHTESMPQACSEHAESMPGACSEQCPLPAPSPAPKALREDSSLRSESLSPDAEAPDSPTAMENGFPPCPHQEIIDLYHEILPELPKVKTWTGQRPKHLAARWRETLIRLKQSGQEHDRAAGLDWWRKFFLHRVRPSPLLMGKIPKKDGGFWSANLPWLILPDNYAKTLENNYRDRRPAA